MLPADDAGEILLFFFFFVISFPLSCIISNTHLGINLWMLAFFLTWLVSLKLQDVRQPKLSAAAGIVKKLHDFAGDFVLDVEMNKLMETAVVSIRLSCVIY